ncbi:MAG TPA: metallophosphatase domain-containing protein [Chitinophagaceae bacterium]|nr:metallophosphatase domain-containing protein [Chitinophagaceae bacterium]
MRIVAISDTHCRHRSLKLPKGDVLVHAGDITNRGQEAEVKDFLKWFAVQPFSHKVFIAGNHDFFLERARPDTIEKLIPAGVTYLNDSGTCIGNLHIWGTPVTPWFYNWAFNRQRGQAIREHWKKIPANTDLLITHGPPFGIMDEVLHEKHAGCRDLLSRVQEIRPKVHLFGHIHEGYGQVQKNGILYINASVVNEAYELTHPPVVFQLEPALL